MEMNYITFIFVLMALLQSIEGQLCFCQGNKRLYGHYQKTHSGLSRRIGMKFLGFRQHYYTAPTQKPAQKPIQEPTIKIISPQDGYLSTLNKVTVTWSVTNFDVPTQGHYHVYLDYKAYDMTNNRTITIPLAGGPHEIKVELVNNDHEPLRPPVFHTIRYNVSLPQTLIYNNNFNTVTTDTFNDRVMSVVKPQTGQSFTMNTTAMVGKITTTGLGWYDSEAATTTAIENTYLQIREYKNDNQDGTESDNALSGSILAQSSYGTIVNYPTPNEPAETATPTAQELNPISQFIFSPIAMFIEAKYVVEWVMSSTYPVTINFNNTNPYSGGQFYQMNGGLNNENDFPMELWEVTDSTDMLAEYIESCNNQPSGGTECYGYVAINS